MSGQEEFEEQRTKRSTLSSYYYFVWVLISSWQWSVPKASMKKERRDRIGVALLS